MQCPGLLDDVIVKTDASTESTCVVDGFSGVQTITVERILDMYNNNVLPVVFDRGSLGASGDLAPLANLFLPLIGEGEVWYKGKRIRSAEALNIFGWKPIRLMSKEGSCPS